MVLEKSTQMRETVAAITSPNRHEHREIALPVTPTLLSKFLIKFNERSKNHSEMTSVISVRAGSQGEYSLAP